MEDSGKMQGQEAMILFLQGNFLLLWYMAAELRDATSSGPLLPLCILSQVQALTFCKSVPGKAMIAFT